MQDDHITYRFNILLVDDDSEETSLTQKAFLSNMAPVVIHVVPNGMEAMRYLRKEGKYQDKPRPDLILLDLNMPVMDGKEALVEIKKDEYLLSIPVIVFSVSSRQEDIAHAYHLHANCYIIKPSDWKDIKRVIKCIEELWLTVARLPDGQKC